MTQEEAVAHWQKRARAELTAAHILFEKGEPDVYGEVLFHCHLALELAMKAAYIREKDMAAPFTHNLSELASFFPGVAWQNERDAFDQITEYAVLARYGDPQWFVQHATKKNAARWLEKTEKFLSEILP